jgi:3-oxoacyl-[acyl-carrier protein] reductase
VDLHLADRRFIVAGSSRGIGAAIAAELVREGATVCISGRDPETLAAARRQLDAGTRVLAVSVDLTTAAGVADLFAACTRAWDGIDGVVANVGSGRGTRGWEQNDDEWTRALDLNLRASVMTSRAAIPLLAARGGGSITFVSSITGVEATAAPLAYSAAKAALINYSKNLARDVAAHGIRVNSIAPGNVLVPGGSWDQRLHADPDGTRTMLERDVPLHRFASPDEIASLATFLCSDRAAFVTGACFVVDGGQTRSL